MTKSVLPGFVFVQSDDDYRTGEVVAWLATHCVIRWDCLHDHQPGESEHPLLTGLVPLSDLEEDSAIFFRTRRDLEQWVAYMEAHEDLATAQAVKPGPGEKLN